MFSIEKLGANAMHILSTWKTAVSKAKNDLLKYGGYQNEMMLKLDKESGYAGKPL